MKNGSAVLQIANAISAVRSHSAAAFMLGLIAVASISGCTSDASLNSKVSATYHTGFSPHATPDQVLANK